MAMFASEAMTEYSRKRPREYDDSSINLFTGFGEHRSKRLQKLPFRSQLDNHSAFPLSPRPTYAISNADPTDAVKSANQPVVMSSWPPDTVLPASADYSMDVDPVFVSPLPPPHPASYSSQVQHQQSAAMVHGPLPLQLAAAVSPCGRLPTPMQPSFPSHVRGHHQVWAGPGPALHNSSYGVAGLGILPELESCVPRTIDPSNCEWPLNWSAVQNRQLPSPISEDDDTTMSSFSPPPGLDLDLGGSFSDSHSPPFLDLTHPNGMDIQSSHQLRHQSPSSRDCQIALSHTLSGHHNNNFYTCNLATIPSSPSAIDVPTGTESPASSSTSVSPATPSRKGHARSRHTINSSTWQPGMKKCFSIGYRAECEKCRLGVPGHFNHINVS